MNDAQVLVTGRHLAGPGLRAIGPVLQDLILSAQNELHLMAYLMTESAAPLVDLLESALGRGIKVTLVLNDFPGNSAEMMSRLRSLRQRHGRAIIVTYSEGEGGPLHAKVLVADRRRAVVGSANLSWGGMVTNNEVALLVEDSSAWVLATLIDRLVSQLNS
jgi:phosphatidylserine/phosphatidylglycerophosphate/cardiolipin synthase-like enzyme